MLSTFVFDDWSVLDGDGVKPCLLEPFACWSSITRIEAIVWFVVVEFEYYSLEIKGGDSV